MNPLELGCQTRGQRDDFKIFNEFRQYCYVTSSNKCLAPVTQVTRYEHTRVVQTFFFLEINSTSRYIARFLEIDARRSGDGVERRERKRIFVFFLDIAFISGYITEIVARRSSDLHSENFMLPSAKFPTYNVASRSQ